MALTPESLMASCSKGVSLQLTTEAKLDSGTIDLIDNDLLEAARATTSVFPEFRIAYFESGASHERFVDSVNGRLHLKLNPGNSLHYFRIERRGTHTFDTKADCVYKQAGSESDDVFSAMNGARCPSIAPLTDSRYIKRFSAELLYNDPAERPFSLAYRGWVGKYGDPNFYQPDPQTGGYWYSGPGAKCGTAQDNFWITAFEFAASPIG